MCHSRAVKQGVAAAVSGPEISALVFAKAVSAVNRCRTMEEQAFGLQPQDRRHDSSGQEHWRIYNVPVCLSVGVKSQWSYLLLTNRVISPPAMFLKDINIHTNTHTE